MITIMAFFPLILGTFFKRKSKNQLIFLGKDLLENIELIYPSATQTLMPCSRKQNTFSVFNILDYQKVKKNYF